MSSPDDDFPERLEQAKRANVPQLLMKCARLVNDRGMARAAERFGFPLRASHTALFPHIDLEGTRLTELARRVGVSTQAVGQIVGELEAGGVLVREPDPQDGRAKLVRFADGGRSLLEGLAVLGEVETELEAEIGRRAMRSLHAALVALLDALERSPQTAS